MAFDRIWWVQNVLPLTFDNSLSYYEVLAKITRYLNGLSEDVENVIKTLGTIEGIQDVEAYTQFLESIQNSIGSLASLDTDEKDDIVSAINEVLDVAKKAYVKPKDGIPESDLDENLQIKINNQGVSSYNQLTDKPSINGVTLKGNVTGNALGLGTYSKPAGGIPESDLSTEVQEKLNQQGGGSSGTTNYNALSNKPSINGVTLSGNKTPAELGLGTYSIPDGGIPMEALSTEVQEAIAAGGGSGGTSNYNALINKPSINGHTLIGNVTLEDLGANYYVKPASGIPESDLSNDVKEKLNASSGIANNIDKFVADDNYSSGDLIYINGVLYKFTKNVLKGTELTEGDNIEKTDINSELSKINEKIELIESGEGPDSWSLTGEAHARDAGDLTRLFEYFSGIGGEDYIIIVTPEANINSEYQIDVKKRDGTIVTNYVVNTNTNYQKRFTFTPDETGEYYLEFKLITGTGYPNGKTWRITIEYTQSQGISELWAQVNKAAQLEPRVEAVETLVGQQQTDLSNLNGIPARVTTVENKVSKVENNLGNKLNILNGTFANKVWTEQYYSMAIPVNPGDNVQLTTETRTSTYGVLKTFVPEVGNSADFSTASGFTDFHSIATNTTVDLVMPADAGVLFLYAGANTNYDRLPINIIINGIDIQGDAFSQIGNIIESFNNENSELDGRVKNLEDTLENYDSDIAPTKLQPYGIEPQSLSLFKTSVNLFSDFCYHIKDSYYSSTVVPPSPVRVTRAPGWQGWLIALKPNTTYTCGPLDYRLYFFGKDYIFTERIQEVDSAGNNTFTTGSKTTWVAITQRTTRDMSAWMLVEGDTYPEEYVSGYPQWVLEPSSVAVDKTIAFMGDSITAGVGATKTYHEYLHDKYHFTCLNYGFGGSGFVRNSPSNTAGRIGMGVPGRGEPTTPDNFFTPNNIVTRLQELDSNAINGIVIFAGTNDYGNNVALEDYENAIEEAFTYCYSNLPLAPILVLTPVHRRTGSEPNSTGHTLRDYVDALIEKCKKFGVAYIDTMTMSGLYPANDANKNTYFSVDNTGLHPDFRGHKRIASVVGSMLKDMIDYTSFN